MFQYKIKKVCSKTGSRIALLLLRHEGCLFHGVPDLLRLPAARSSSSGQRFTGLYQFIRSCGNSNWCHIGGIRVLHMLNGCSPSGGLSNHTGKNKSDKPAGIYSSDNPVPTASPAPAATQPTTRHWACADRRGGRAQQSPPSARRVRTSV